MMEDVGVIHKRDRQVVLQMSVTKCYVVPGLRVPDVIVRCPCECQLEAMRLMRQPRLSEFGM